MSLLFNKFLAKKSAPDEKGCLPKGMLQHTAKGKHAGKRNCISLKRMNKLISLPKSGKINPWKIPAAFNTIQMSRLLLLPPKEINRVIRDLDSKIKTARAMARAVLILESRSRITRLISLGGSNKSLLI